MDMLLTDVVQKGTACTSAQADQMTLHLDMPLADLQKATTDKSYQADQMTRHLDMSLVDGQKSHRQHI